MNNKLIIFIESRYKKCTEEFKKTDLTEIIGLNTKELLEFACKRERIIGQIEILLEIKTLISKNEI